MTKTKLILLAGAVLTMAMTACGGGNKGPIQLKNNQFGDYKYCLNDEGNGIVITGYTGAGGKVYIPAKIEEVSVVEIGENAFRGNSRERQNPRPGDSITSVVIPNGVRKIGRGAFSDCRNLISVTLPDTVVEIREVAFRGCTTLISANIPAGLKIMGLNAFFSDRELSNLSIPDSMTVIKWQGWNHFSGCRKLPPSVQQRLKALGYPAGF